MQEFECELLKRMERKTVLPLLKPSDSRFAKLAESPQPRCDAEAVCQCRGTRRSVKISGATMLCEFYGSSSIIYWRS